MPSRRKEDKPLKSILKRRSTKKPAKKAKRVHIKEPSRIEKAQMETLRILMRESPVIVSTREHTAYEEQKRIAWRQEREQERLAQSRANEGFLTSFFNLFFGSSDQSGNQKPLSP